MDCTLKRSRLKCRCLILERSAISSWEIKKKKKRESSIKINTILVGENYLVVSKIVTFQEFIQSRKKFVVVEGIDGFYITGAVI